MPPAPGKTSSRACPVHSPAFQTGSPRHCRAGTSRRFFQPSGPRQSRQLKRATGWPSVFPPPAFHSRIISGTAHSNCPSHTSPHDNRSCVSWRWFCFTPIASRVPTTGHWMPTGNPTASEVAPTRPQTSNVTIHGWKPRSGAGNTATRTDDDCWYGSQTPPSRSVTAARWKKTAAWEPDPTSTHSPPTSNSGNREDLSCAPVRCPQRCSRECSWPTCSFTVSEARSTTR